jgi:ferritin
MVKNKQRKKQHNKQMLLKKQIPDALKQLLSVIGHIKENRVDVENRMKIQIENVIIKINKYDKIFVLGGIAAKVLETTQNSYTHFENQYYKKNAVEDDNSEILLEYAMSLATAYENTSTQKPTITEINTIYQSLLEIKNGFNMIEIADNSVQDTKNDAWLRLVSKLDAQNVRGDGYMQHIKEIYTELFSPFDNFLFNKYGFNSSDILNCFMLQLDNKIYSKIGNPLGAYCSWQRYRDWFEKYGQEGVFEKMKETKKHFMQLFLSKNPDLNDQTDAEQCIVWHLNDVNGYDKIFWIIPNNEIEEKIFNQLSMKFGDNGTFLTPDEFKGFPLNDSLVKINPIINVGNKYYCFSTLLPFRNIFRITEELIKKDKNYYEQNYKNNSSSYSRDNYVEIKVKGLFERMLSNVCFYHSLNYNIIEDGIAKKPELDILGLSEDSVYIIEVKAGQLNDKDKRGGLKGLRDKILTTIASASSQCQRVLQYIQNENEPSFSTKTDQIKIDKSKIKNIYKITVTLEHYSSLSTNIKELIKAGVLDKDYEDTWVLSLYDLMVFSDYIIDENDLKEYLKYRLEINHRNDVLFFDELDIFGYYDAEKFPLPKEEEGKEITIMNYKGKFDKEYNEEILGVLVHHNTK